MAFDLFTTALSLIFHIIFSIQKRKQNLDKLIHEKHKIFPMKLLGYFVLNATVNS